MIAQSQPRNGKANLNELRQQRESARLRLEISQIERLAHAEEMSSRVVQEAWGAVIDPLEYIHDDPRFGTPRFVGSEYAEIRDGRQGILYDSEQELAEIRSIGRVLGNITPGRGIVRNLVNYTIGTGFVYTAQPRDARQEPPAGLCELVQKVIDRFLDDNHWVNDLDRELRAREEEDGEWFLALYASQGGHTVARIIEPEQITEPNSQPVKGESWTFGVITAAEDVQDVRGYWVQWAAGEPLEVLDAEMVVHVKHNVSRNLKRGVSSFRAVWQELLEARKLRRNTAKGASVQAAIAWIEEMAEGVTQSQAESLRSANTTMRFEQPLPSSAYTASRMRHFQHILPGTRLQVEAGRKFHPGPLGSERAPNFLAVVQACERVAGSAWSMPEYMVTGDASNANYSSTMVAESPFVKHCEVEQERVATDHKRVLWAVIRNAYRAGLFYQFGLTFREIKRCVEIAVDPPRVATRDELAATQRRQILKQEGVLSTETWANLEELDYAEEQERGAKKETASFSQLQNSFSMTQEARCEQAARMLWEGYP